MILLIKSHAEGYYSEAESIRYFVIGTQFVNEDAKTELDSYTLHEHDLDGKHSEIESEVTLTTYESVEDLYNSEPDIELNDDYLMDDIIDLIVDAHGYASYNRSEEANKLVTDIVDFSLAVEKEYNELVNAWTRLEFKVPTELSEDIQDKIQKFIDLEVYRYENR